MKISKLSALLIVMFLALMTLPGLLAFWPTVFKLQLLPSPDGRFSAELIRKDSLDRNYVVNLNGQRIYVSSDFSPRRDLPFRESLAWDVAGTTVVLSVADHRIFGYDAVEQRRLEDDELLALELAPDPPLWEYHYESAWPGKGRALQFPPADVPP